MRIGIDATALPAQPVGAGIYIIHLIKALLSLDSDFEWVVFVHEERRALLGIEEGKVVRVVSVPDQRPAERLLWEQLAFPRLVQALGVDLLHSLHYTRPWRLGCKSVVTFHDMTFFLFPQLHTHAKRVFFPLAIRTSARLADALVAVSENTRKDSIRLLDIPPGKIFTTPLGVSEDFHQIQDRELLERARRKFNLPEKFILYLGVVEPRKNLPFLLRCYASAIEQGLAHRLVIVGRLGWMYEDVFEQVESLELQENVHFAGFIPRQDLPMVYNLADLFVYPSVYEGFGLPVLEAMACGTPVITSNVSAMPEIVGEAGILLPPNDEAAFTQTIMNLLDGTSKRVELSKRGIQRSAQYTWKRTATDTLEVYKLLFEK